MGVILLAVAVLFAVSRYLLKGDDLLSGYIRQLDEMKRKRAAIGSETNRGSEGESMGRLLELDQRLQRRFESESFKYEEREEAFESTIQEYADWEASRDRLDKELRSILSGWGLSYPEWKSILNLYLNFLRNGRKPLIGNMKQSRGMTFSMQNLRVNQRLYFILQIALILNHPHGGKRLAN
ncbi:hypothetical protein RCO48_01295 [Peribacillus frigoritolerans]|nr:hypothetical protein [Peribacillus frigoritolerans]